MTGQTASDSRWTWIPELGQQQLPRYTSYPPANRFNAAVGPADARAAIEALAPGSTLSLYVHIPYCKQLCWYCGCNTSAPTPANGVEPYLQALEAEMRIAASRLPQGVCVSHVHFGGGSPDILTPAQVTRLIALLKANFDLTPLAEIAAELDPRGVTPEVAEAFAEAGLVRASLGLQTLSPDVQRRINRVQPASVVSGAIDALRDSGVLRLNLDMMYGLPGQSVDDILETAHFAAVNDADRVAVFGYAHVPWFKKHQGGIREDELPGPESRFRQAEAAASVLTHAGYQQIGFDHFAAPQDTLALAERAGTMRRNFQGYTDDCADALLAFGASAISSFPDVIWQNAPDTAAYRSVIGSGQLAAVRGVRLSARDRRTGRLIERILCELEADVPTDLRIAACPALGPLEQAGLVQWSGRRLTITNRGRPYARSVAAAFDPELQQSPARHSLAV